MEAKQIEKRLNNLDSNSENYSSDIEVLLLEIRKRISELQDIRIKSFYPKQSSLMTEINNNGLEEERNAILFLSTPQSSRAIVEKMINSLELNKIDFASIMFEKLVPQIPKCEAEWYNLDRTNPGKVQLYKSVQGMYKTFCEKRGIDLIDAELKKLDELLTKINIIKTREVSNANK